MPWSRKQSAAVRPRVGRVKEPLQQRTLRTFVGVTVVQLREKHRDKTDLIRLAKELHAVTRRYNIPLIVNDRVDVAAAAGVEGVHIGQDDTGQHENLQYSICTLF